MKKLMKMVLSAWCLVLGAGVATAAELPAGYNSFKIYEGETLKRDFVPVLNEKGERGLMDLANGNKFYPLKSDYAGLIIARVPAVAVPKGAFIDTGIKPDSETRVTMDVPIDRGESLYGVLEGEYWFGCWTNDYNRGAFCLGNDGVQGIYFAVCDDGGSFFRDGGRVPAGRHTVELTPWEFKVDGTIWAVKPESSRKDFQIDLPLYLFAQNRRGAHLPMRSRERLPATAARSAKTARSSVNSCRAAANPTARMDSTMPSRACSTGT